MHDPVAIDTPASRAIAFTCAERMNAAAILFDNLPHNAERTALIGAFGRWSYADLCARASQCANAFAAAGLAREDRIICLMDDTPDYPAVIFGAMRAGFVPVLLNTLSPADLITFYAQDSGARIAVVDADLARRLGTATFAAAGIATLVVAGGEVASLGGDGSGVHVLSLDAFCTGHVTSSVAADTHRNDMAFWMYSSGSTGKPKGVVHLHHDMAYTAASYSRYILKLTRDDVCFSVPKIFFAYGFGNSCTFPFAAGASAVLLAGRPDPGAVFAAIARHRPTVFFGLPTLYTALIKDAASATADLSSVRLCLSAAEVLAAEVFNAWRERFGHEIVEGLGSTEVLHIYLSNRSNKKRLGAAGLPVPGYEMKLVSIDGTTESETDGVLMVRGPSSAPCYWNRPDKTAETMRGDWIWTGDRFERDADGFYYFRGRADDLIKVSGQWVYPLEVELALADHPAVRECAVLAIELADRRMSLAAYVVLDHGSGDAAMTETLQAYVKGRLLPYKYPRSVTYLAALPKTGTGKIDRQALKLAGPPPAQAQATPAT